MYKDLKYQDTIQASLGIQDLKSPEYSSPPQQYQLTEMNLPVNLQDIQPRPYQVWNCYDIGFDTDVNWRNIVCTYNFFMCDRVWRTQTDKIAPLWRTELIFTWAGGQSFIPPFMVHQITHYNQDIHWHNISSDWVLHHLLSVYMYHNGWNKSMSHFPSMCCSSPLNTQSLFCDEHNSHFDYSSLKILQSHQIHYFIQKEGDSMNDQPNDKGPNLKLNNLYDNTIMNWVRKHGNLNLNPSHMNDILVETCEAFKLSSTTITQ